MSDIEDRIRAARETIKEQQDFIEKVMAQASPYRAVAYVGQDKILLSDGEGVVEVEKPSFPVKVGDFVGIAPQSNQVTKTGIVDAVGVSVMVDRVLSDVNVAITDSMTGGSKTVFKDPNLELQEGDHVFVLGSVVLRLDKSREAPRAATGVTWDDIGGLEGAKAQLREIVELPYTHPGIFSHYGYTPPKGVLLAGPPGCGKTMLGKATATAIAGGGDAAFMYVKGPELLNKYVGQTEQSIRELFIRAGKHREKTGRPAVIFMDEAEALLSTRGSGVSSDMEKTVVPAFLTEMDGLETSAAVVILATNRPDRLDPAVVRDGRIDRKIEVTRPAEREIRVISALNIGRAPVDSSCNKDGLVDMITNALSAGVLHENRSGALVVNLVERAKSFALHRDLQEGTVTGLRGEDIEGAIALVAQEAMLTAR